jgi:Fic family protein
VDLELFGKSPAGRVVQVGKGEAAYWAFVPHPLPPKLEPDKGLWQALGEAMLSVGRLDGLARDLPDPHLLIAPFVRREAVVSSRIEGTRAELLDLYAYEAGQRPPRGSTVPEEDVREVYNYVRALEYGLQRRESLPLSLRFLRELHGLLLEGVRGEQYTPGEFRASQNWIGRPGSTLSTATYVPPPPAELRSALADFERYLYVEDEYPSLVRLAFLHYQFEAIHPFLDGNGRIGRLLLALLLVHWGLVSQPLLYLSEYFERNRRDYYDLLLAVSQHGAWREWVQFFVLGVAEQGERTVRRAKAVLDLQAEWKRLLTAQRASTLTLKLADSLLERPTLTIRQAQELLGTSSFNTAKRHIDRLVGMGILEAAGGEAYDHIYRTPDIARILQEVEEQGT